MKPNLLKEELRKLQVEYRMVLENALENIYQKDSNAVIDEIKVFWFRNKKLVQCILNYLHEPYTAYVFTAATMLDLDDYEHYPFVSLGKYHFWDDPISMYSEVAMEIDNTPFGEQIHEQIALTIKDNIDILDNARDIIYILPIRLLSNIDTKLTHRAAQQAFLSLFRNDIDFDHYKEHFNTISDIRKELAVGIENSIIFSDDDVSLDFETRFKNYKDSNVFPLSTNSTDAEIFRFVIYGYLAQAFDTILICSEYQLIPYIRFEVAFKYILIVSGNFGESPELKDMVFKCIIAHTLHYTFDKRKIHNVDFRKYSQEIQNSDFENELFSNFQKEKVSMDNPSLDKMVSIINKSLEEVLAKCVKVHE